MHAINSFRTSIAFAFALSGVFVAPTMLMAWFPFGLTYQTPLASSVAPILAICALPVFCLSVWGSRRCSIGARDPATGMGTDRLAIASLVLSFPIFAAFSVGVTSLAGLVVGVLALRRIHRGGRHRGVRIAIGGIVLSTVTLAFGITSWFFLGP